MASSQVQMASAHFGCVFRDHNWRHRDKERENKDNVRAQPHVSFEKNLKVLVRDHLHSRIAQSGSRDSVSASAENSENQVDNREKNGDNFRPLSRRSEEAQVQDESSPSSRKQSRVVDRWATRKAREMSTTTERQTYEAELMALSNSHPVSTVASTFLGESPRAIESPCAPSETSADLPNLHASSLVQMWKEFEAESKLISGNHDSFKSNSTISSGDRLNSGTSNIDSASSDEDPSPRSEVCDSGDERYETPMAHEDSFTDWGSEQNTPSERLLSSQVQRVSNVGESERLGVADIIRRLTSGKPIKMENSSIDETDREQPVVIDPVPEHRGKQRVSFVNVGKSPRVRGRQAMMDLLVQLERERQRELNELVERRVVSRFPQRGRIQSMLKLRFLKGVVVSQDQQRPPFAASKPGRLQQGTSILALRQKFSPKQDAGEVHGEESGDNSNSHTQLLNNTTDSEHSGTSNQLMNEEVHQQETRIEQENTRPVHHSMPSSSENFQEEGQSSDRAWEGKSLVVSDLLHKGSIKTATVSHDSEGSDITEEPEPNTQQFGGSTDGTWLGDVSQPRRDWRGSVQSWCQDLLSNNSEDGNVATDEPEPGTQELVGSADGTWLGDVSYSERDWRHSRQAWYGDVLDDNSEDRERNVAITEQESDMQQLAGSTDETWLADGAHPQTYWGGQSWYQNVLENNSEDEGNEVTDKPDPDTEQLEGSIDGTWLGNVSRPPRDWRRSRQEWCQEMLENSSENGEIRELLQRRSVSNFLASDLKETIESSLQRQSHQPETVGGEEHHFEHPYLGASDASYHFASTSSSFNLPSSTSYNLPLPSQLRTQNWYQDHEVIDNSDRVASTSLQSVPYHCQDNLQSAVNHPSLEMDLISDLRGHMLQLHNEISELRKSMESCTDMQNKLHHSIKKEVSAAVYHSVHGGEGTELFNWLPIKKGKCCICYEMQVDSLLYRCGHMCTCFKCAHELQWSSGRCPICRAPILDVVRAYANS
ncbi:uncharacterized protein LOC122060047 [Macadamia integrifolia]|uniref:uncharacterized protein LOC122060047 n=1 Tax=Macadamia integrifolia TaxID=60698 RepID=UPI001C5283BB|nr:uncharacterized protein LOC122060047 [Macadamia integrifolia]XP_042479132.1 uncharacterized protein LOC122060047 [Macadamia integrifolia]XP_042479133.1 uncharacterized protein LOC122060047 [Macadamia integrifolia]XP_042479134.1 uncharacterized protein LOC122060047 [Macadamia integrifolia]